MTYNKKFAWDRLQVTSYAQQNSEEPLSGRQPDNVLGTINHFSKKRKLRKYSTVADYGEECDGYAKRLDYEEIDFWCLLKPVSSSANKFENTVINDMSGQYNEGELILYYNPFHPEYPDDESVVVQLSTDGDEYSGFSDILVYRDELWIITKQTKIDTDYDTDEQFIGKCFIERWDETAHTKNIDKQEFTPSNYQIK